MSKRLFVRALVALAFWLDEHTVVETYQEYWGEDSAEEDWT